jgi:hypothetical protein
VSTKDFSLYQRSIMDDLGSWLVNNLISNNITRGDNKWWKSKFRHRIGTNLRAITKLFSIQPYLIFRQGIRSN